MCGIAGVLTAQPPAAPLALEALAHRGPDGTGTWLSADARCWLGHRRLAILDLSPAAAQPMLDPATGNAIVFNGEIYNHRELRAELGAHPWRSTSDTETLLVGYTRWGISLVERLRGMFAFALWHAASGQLILARDRLGIKPLYWRHDARGFAFASESRLLSNRPRPAPAALAAWLARGHLDGEATLDPAVQLLAPGAVAFVPPGTGPRIERYWPPAEFPPPRRAATTPTALVRAELERAVDEHLLADVPVASFLSGGIDSAIITALAARHHRGRLLTFSVGFPQREHDETDAAAEVARRHGTNHHRIEVGPAEALTAVREAVARFDAPSIDGLNTYLVARQVAAQGVKVALTGLGGDELFGGYPLFREVPRLARLARWPRPLRAALAVLGPRGRRLAEVPGTDPAQCARWRRRLFSNRALAEAGLPSVPDQVAARLPATDEFAAISAQELTGYLHGMLLRDADQMAMAVSLETRVPFLDHRLVETVLPLPAASKIGDGRPKSLLLAACDDLLPRAVWDRPKRGFVLPMDDWLRGPLADFAQEGLDQLRSAQVLADRFVARVAADFAARRVHWSRLWALVVLGHWLTARPARS
jgi:asparagine synthase (glutamine-hydrolysing)